MKVFEMVVHALFPIVWISAIGGSIYVITEEKKAMGMRFRLKSSQGNKGTLKRQTKV